jgi:hypothetical protein
LRLWGRREVDIRVEGVLKVWKEEALDPILEEGEVEVKP